MLNRKHVQNSINRDQLYLPRRHLDQRVPNIRDARLGCGARLRDARGGAHGQEPGRRPAARGAHQRAEPRQGGDAAVLGVLAPAGLLGPHLPGVELQGVHADGEEVTKK